jgi:uncharacterized membrane protein
VEECSVHRFSRKKDERGAILVVSAVGLVLALIMGGMAVDLGFLAQEARTNQKIADLAALDAVRALPADPTAAARESAARNGVTDLVPPNFVVETGNVSAGEFTPAPLGSSTAVRVSVMSVHDNQFPFLNDGQEVTRRGIASKENRAQFSVGSKLASVTTNENSTLNRVLDRILGSALTPDVNMSVLSYQGLAGGTVSISELIAADPSLGSPDSLMNSNVSLRRLAQASVSALNNKAAGGDTAALAAVTPLTSLASTIDTSMMVKLSDILSVQQPADPAAAAADLQYNVFDFLVAGGLANIGTAARIANGTNFVEVPGLTVTVPGLTSATMKLTVIEPPRISAFGPARFDTSTGTWATTAHTAQIKLDLNTNITVAVPPVCVLVCLPSALSVSLQLPLSVGAAKATGSLTAVECPTDALGAADILVDTTAASATSAADLDVSVAGLPLPLPPLINTSVPVGGGSDTLSFTGPPLPTAIQSTAATGLGLTTATTAQFGVLGVQLGPVLGLLSPVTNAIDNQILGPTFNALGLAVGGADVRVLRIECGVPALVG